MKRFVHLALLAIAICGCSKPFQPCSEKGPGRVQRVELIRAAPLELSSAETRVSRLEPGPFEGSTQRVRIDPGARFNRVDLELSCLGAPEVVLSAFAGGEERFQVRGALFDDEKRQGVSLSVAYAQRETEDIDELLFVFEGAGSVQLHSIELVHEAWEARLVGRGETPELGRVWSEARRAYALETGSRLRADVRLPRGGELMFSLAVPQNLIDSALSPELLMVVNGKQGELLRKRYALYDQSAESRWSDVRVFLDYFGEKRLEIAFELVSQGEDEAFALLSQPMIVSTVREPQTFVLITSDTHRADHVAAMSGSGVDTPHLDALAARGVLFEDAFSSTNVTNPSHAALLTGVHPRDTRVVDNTTKLIEEAFSVSEAFRDAGFLTFASLSAAHLEDSISGLGQGFDRMSAPLSAERWARSTVEEARSWLDQVECLPVFLWVHLFDPHTPYSPPAEHFFRYWPQERNAFDPELPDPLPAELLPPWMPGLKDLDFPRALYRSEVYSMDLSLGELLAHPRLSNARIAFTADHGESLGEHEVYWDHAGLYPESIHVPLVLCGEGVRAGTRVALPARNIDIGRTLLDWADLGSVDFPGRSLLAWIDGEVAQEPRFALASYGNEASITSGPWHFILHLRDHIYGPPGVGALRKQHFAELYRLDRDPDCLENRLSEEQATALSLCQELVAWLRARDSEGLAYSGVIDAGAKGRLTALGYTGDSDGRQLDEPWVEADCDCAELISDEGDALMSFVTHLESAIDGTRLPARELATTHEKRPLWVRYDLDAVRAALRREDLLSRPNDLWRYRELLPLEDERHRTTLGEGMTPLLDCPRLAAAMGVRQLLVKDESQLPTGSFKSRGMALAVSMAKELGVKRVAIPTAGNAGGALAAYAARAGMECFVFMPDDTPEVNRLEAQMFGARVYLVDGLINDCGAMVREGSERMGWFDVSTLKEPYRLEGKKTMGLELAEQMNWSLPDAIFYPTGGGTGLIGMWKAFAELEAIGWLEDERRPRMFSCQSDGCAPIAEAFERGTRFGVTPDAPHTVASGLRVPVAVGDFMILDAVRASKGAAMSAAEGRIGEWTRRASELEGLSLAPEAAICLGVLETALERGLLESDTQVVVFNTGALQKYVEFLRDEAGPAPRLELGSVDWERLESAG